MNIFRNRTIVGLICIGLSLVICFGITPLFNGALKAQTGIIRVTKDINKGDEITPDKLEHVKVGAYNLPSNVVKNMEEVKGKYAAADLVKGDYILTSKITDTPYGENAYLYKLDGRKLAISVSIKSFALGLSGKLRADDIVSVIASDFGDSRQTLMLPELKYVKVLAVTSAKGTDENTQKMVKSSGSNNEEKELPSTVTLLVNDTQAKLLAELEAKSKIHLALVYRGDAASAQKFLDAQDKALGNGAEQGAANLQTSSKQEATPASEPNMQGGVPNAQ